MATKRYKRNLKEFQTRRRRGVQMLAHRIVQAEGAGACEVGRQTESRWFELVASDR